MLAERIAPTQLAEMSAQGAVLAARLRPHDLPRLAGLLAKGVPAGQFLDVRVKASAGPTSGVLLDIGVRGVVQLVCQRCFGAVDWQIDANALLTAVADEAAAGDLADPFDIVLLEPDGSLRLRDAVEDEILAALPLAPRHDDSTACGIAAGAAPGNGTQVNKPFAGLRAMIGSTGGKDE